MLNIIDCHFNKCTGGAIKNKWTHVWNVTTQANFAIHERALFVFTNRPTLLQAICDWRRLRETSLEGCKLTYCCVYLLLYMYMSYFCVYSVLSIDDWARAVSTLIHKVPNFIYIYLSLCEFHPSGGSQNLTPISVVKNIYYLLIIIFQKLNYSSFFSI